MRAVRVAAYSEARMSERAKTTRPQRTRPARDPRIDSLPPAVDEEAPLKAKPLRSGADPLHARVALLEAEVESLKVARAADSDDLAQMLIRVAEAERLRAAAEQRAADAEARHAAAIEALGVAQARAREAAPVSTVDARAAMDKVESWLEELERGETMAQALRVWMIQQARLAAREAVSVPGVDLTPAAPPGGGAVALDDADVEPLD